jgi:hypothetical protein
VLSLFLPHSISPLYLHPCEDTLKKAPAKCWCLVLGLPKIHNCEKLTSILYKLPSLMNSFIAAQNGLRHLKWGMKLFWQLEAYFFHLCPSLCGARFWAKNCWKMMGIPVREHMVYRKSHEMPDVSSSLNSPIPFQKFVSSYDWTANKFGRTWGEILMSKPHFTVVKNDVPLLLGSYVWSIVAILLFLTPVWFVKGLGCQTFSLLWGIIL